MNSSEIQQGVADAQVAPVEWLLSEDGQSLYSLMPNPDARSIRRGHPAMVNRYYARVSGDQSAPHEDTLATVKAMHRALNAYPKLVGLCKAAVPLLVHAAYVAHNKNDVEAREHYDDTRLAMGTILRELEEDK